MTTHGMLLCPFCGAPPYDDADASLDPFDCVILAGNDVGRYAVHCSVCSATGPAGVAPDGDYWGDDAEADAVVRWNAASRKETS